MSESAGISILVVDDNEGKIHEIQQVISDLALGDAIAIETAHSESEALAMMARKAFKLLVLDMNIPVRQGENAQPGGGIQVLKILKQGQHRMPEHVLGLTAFQDLQKQFTEALNDDSWSLVFYSPNSNDWRNRLAQKVLHIVAAEDSRKNGFKCDMAIITALELVELEAVLALPANWQQKELPGDDTIYHVGRFEKEKRTLEVVAAAAIDMGMPPATALAMKVISQFRPRYLVMAGITGGVKGRGIAYGDVVIADPCFDRQSGKSKSDKQGVLRLRSDSPQPPSQTANRKPQV